MDRPKLTELLPADIQFLEDELYDFNSATTNIHDGRSLAVTVRDDAGKLVGAAAGHTWGGTCELRQVWVAASLRHQGLGRRLLEAAEAEALRRGCAQIVLTTHSFQAPAFYRRLGFVVLFELPDYPAGYSVMMMRKQLSGANDATPTTR
jgi:ribosomal protein S18 acetylase RimI-like enzyme